MTRVSGYFGQAIQPGHGITEQKSVQLPLNLTKTRNMYSNT